MYPLWSAVRGTIIKATSNSITYEIPMAYEAGSLKIIRLVLPHDYLTAAGDAKAPAVLEITPEKPTARGVLPLPPLVGNVLSLG